MARGPRCGRRSSAEWAGQVSNFDRGDLVRKQADAVWRPCNADESEPGRSKIDSSSANCRGCVARNGLAGLITGANVNTLYRLNISLGKCWRRAVGARGGLLGRKSSGELDFDLEVFVVPAAIFAKKSALIKPSASRGTRNKPLPRPTGAKPRHPTTWKRANRR